jgi:hypothetical protein
MCGGMSGRDVGQQVCPHMGPQWWLVLDVSCDDGSFDEPFTLIEQRGIKMCRVRRDEGKSFHSLSHLLDALRRLIEQTPDAPDRHNRVNQNSRP